MLIVCSGRSIRMNNSDNALYHHFQFAPDGKMFVTCKFQFDKNDYRLGTSNTNKFKEHSRNFAFFVFRKNKPVRRPCLECLKIIDELNIEYNPNTLCKHDSNIS